jgi:PEP-CTERM motif
MRSKSGKGLAAPLASLVAVLVVSCASGAPVVFTLDSAQSYVTLAIPNFSYSNLAISINGQNATNGAPLATAWSSTTGSTAHVSGTLFTQLSGSIPGQALTGVQFVSGANNLVALASGDYRPNPAAFNAATTAWNDNSAAPANYGFVAHASLGNGALVSFSNTNYDIGGPTPASGTTGSGTFPVFGLLVSADFTAAVQALPTVLGTLVPNFLGPVSLGDEGETNESNASGTYTFTSPTNLRITVPLLVPFETTIGAGSNTIMANGVVTGQFVANAVVPEPSTILLAGAGLLCLAIWQRRRWCRPSG